MIKSLLLISVLLFFSISTFGQKVSKNRNTFLVQNSDEIGGERGQNGPGNTYSFSKYSGAYSPLLGATSINKGQLWDDLEGEVIPIGFSFQLYHHLIDFLYFGEGVGGMLTDKNQIYAIVPFETDLIDRGDLTGVSQSPVLFKVTGVSGSKILKVEFSNAGFYDEGDSLGTLNDFINFQMWLYEGSNDIEFHFGSNKITNPQINYYGELGAYIGISDYDGEMAYLLTGDPDNPTLVDTIATLNGTPKNGTIYKFTNNITNIEFNNSKATDVIIYPNPFHDFATLKITNHNIEGAQIRISNIYGQTVQIIESTNSNEILINRENFGKGIYFYYLHEKGNSIASGKFIVE